MSERDEAEAACYALINAAETVMAINVSLNGDGYGVLRTLLAQVISELDMLIDAIEGSRLAELAPD